MQSSFEFTIQEVRGTSNAVEAGHKRMESTTVTKNEAKIEYKGRKPQRHDGKHTEDKNSRTSSHEDKVEMQDITSKYKVVKYVDKKTWSGTQISSR